MTSINIHEVVLADGWVVNCVRDMFDASCHWDVVLVEIVLAFFIKGLQQLGGDFLSKSRWWHHWWLCKIDRSGCMSLHRNRDMYYGRLWWLWWPEHVIERHEWWHKQVFGSESIAVPAAVCGL